MSNDTELTTKIESTAISLKGPVWVVDDDLVRESIVFMLSAQGYEANDFESPKTFLETVDITLPGVLVLDLRMPEMSGSDVQAKLKEANSPLSIVFLSGHGSVGDAVKSMSYGALSFLEKPVNPDLLFEMVDKGLKASHKEYEEKQIFQKIESLSKREYQIFERMCQGVKTVDIAEELGLSARTVEVHRAHIANKLGDASLIRVLYGLLPIEKFQNHK